MKKTVTLFLVLVLAFSLGASKVNYIIDDSEDQMKINTSIKMDCSDCPVSKWQLTWQTPPNADVLWVNGTEGPAEKVEEGTESVKITTTTSPQDSEIIRIGMRVDKDAQKIKDDLHKREIRLPGFKGEKTAVSVKNDQILSGWASFGFDTAFDDKKMSAVGKGPVNLRWKFGEGEETRYYEFFGYQPDGSVDETYKISVGTLGIIQGFKRFPVGVLSDREYNISVNEWSSGEYVSGSIRLRSSLEEDFNPVLAHEVVHGLNDRSLRWDNTDSTYFDEGTAKYVEFLVRNKLYREGEIDIGPANIFGKDKDYRTEENGRTFVYTVRSRGDREKLWGYYRDNHSFMKNWNPFDYEKHRKFGYAYSELIIRNHVRNNGTVRELYKDMNFDSHVVDPEEKWEFFSKRLEMEPCNYDSKQKFNECLDEINSYEYPTYTSSPNITSREIVIEKHNLPERTETKSSNGSSLKSLEGPDQKKLRNLTSKILRWLRNLFSN